MAGRYFWVIKFELEWSYLVEEKEQAYPDRLLRVMSAHRSI